MSVIRQGHSNKQWRKNNGQYRFYYNHNSCVFRICWSYGIGLSDLENVNR